MGLRNAHATWCLHDKRMVHRAKLLKVNRDRAVITRIGITLAKLVRSAVWRRAWCVCLGKGLGFTSPRVYISHVSHASYVATPLAVDLNAAVILQRHCDGSATTATFQKKCQRRKYDDGIPTPTGGTHDFGFPPSIYALNYAVRSAYICRIPGQAQKQLGLLSSSVKLIYYILVLHEADRQCRVLWASALRQSIRRFCLFCLNQRSLPPSVKPST